VSVSLVGTDVAPQGLAHQVEELTGSGAEVHFSNASATRRAVELIGHHEGTAR
jgi:FdrA protein